MRTIREQFQTSGKPLALAKLLAADPEFENVCNYALLQLQSELPVNAQVGSATDPYVGLDANAQMHGAQRIVQILQTIHQPVKEPATPKKDRLNYG